MQHVFQMQQA